MKVMIEMVVMVEKIASIMKKRGLKIMMQNVVKRHQLTDAFMSCSCPGTVFTILYFSIIVSYSFTVIFLPFQYVE